MLKCLCAGHYGRNQCPRVSRPAGLQIDFLSVFDGMEGPSPEQHCNKHIVKLQVREQQCVRIPQLRALWALGAHTVPQCLGGHLGRSQRPPHCKLLGALWALWGTSRASVPWRALRAQSAPPQHLENWGTVGTWGTLSASVRGTTGAISALVSHGPRAYRSIS